jgi:hypothetical protein
VPIIGAGSCISYLTQGFHLRMHALRGVNGSVGFHCIVHGYIERASEKFG